MDILVIHSLYIPYMHICFLDMFHVFSLVCFLIYGVKSKSGHWKGVISEEKRRKPALLTRTCPPGLAKVGPDMTEVRVLVQFGTFRVQKWYFDEMT